MIDIFVLVIFILLLSPILYIFDLSPYWLTIPFVLATLPGFWGMFTGGPFVPSKKSRIATMFNLAELKPGQKVYDLGCGDGRIVKKAAQQGATATGYEISIGAWFIAKIRCLFNKNAKIRYGNFWQQDFQDADVIFCYLLGPTMRKFADKIWPTLKPGTKVISNGFEITTLPVTISKDKVHMYVKD